eukprot:6671154-Prymnesium_polylepis.1
MSLPSLTIMCLSLTFVAQSAVSAMILAGSTPQQPSRPIRTTKRTPAPPMMTAKLSAHGSMLHAAGDEPPALITLARALTDEDARAIRNPDGSIALALSEDAMATSLPSESQSSKSRQQQRRHSAMGPVLLSWATAATTLSLQALLTDQAGLGQDAAAFCAFLCGSLPGGATCIQDPALQHLTLYVTLWLNIVGSSFLLIPNLYPTQQAVDDRGNLLAAEVPQRYSRMAQHELNRVDC